KPRQRFLKQVRKKWTEHRPQNALYVFLIPDQSRLEVTSTADRKPFQQCRNAGNACGLMGKPAIGSRLFQRRVEHQKQARFEGANRASQNILARCFTSPFSPSRLAQSQCTPMSEQ